MPDIVRRTRPPSDLAYLATGEENFSRLIANTLMTASNQSLRIGWFTARKSQAITQVRVVTGTTAAAATPTLIRYGVYQELADTSGSLVASTANDTALLAVVGTQYPKALSVGFSTVAGVRYGIGVLVVTGAAAPTLVGIAPNASLENSLLPRISTLVGGQADLPATISAATLNASTAGSAPYGVLLP